MEQDIRLNINLGMSLEHMIEEMLLNMEAYNYERGEEEHFVKMIKEIYEELITINRNEYKEQYRVFESEVLLGLKNIISHYALSVYLKEKNNVLKAIPSYWKYTLHNLTTLSFLTLGRIFGTDSKYTIDTFFNSLGQNIDYFSFENVLSRKENELDRVQYFKDQDKLSEFNRVDYRSLKSCKKKLQKKYKNTFRELRHKIVAHREVLIADELPNDGEFKYIELLELYIELYNIKNELWQREHNGRSSSKLTFEILEEQVKQARDVKNPTPEYIFVVRDILKLVESLDSNSSKGD